MTEDERLRLLEEEHYWKVVKQEMEELQLETCFGG